LTRAAETAKVQARPEFAGFGAAAAASREGGETQTHADQREALGADVEPRAARVARLRAGISPEFVRVLPLLLPVLIATAVVVVAAVAAFVSPWPDGGTVAGVLALLAAAAIAEALPIPIEGVSAGRTSLATVPIVASAALYGWPSSTLVAFVAMAIVEVARQKPPTRTAYNTSVYALAGFAAGAAADAVEAPGVPRLVVTTLVACAAFYVVDITLLSAVVARSQQRSWPHVVAPYFKWTLVPAAVLASLTVILVVLWNRSPYAAFALAGPLASIVLYERRMHAALRRLREIDRLKDEFIAVVSHELRTPLASVYGAAMTLQRQQLNAHAQDEMLAIIYRESERLARLVDQVLWASRLDSERARISIEPFDAVQLAKDVVDAAHPQLPPNLWLDLSYQQTLPSAVGDPEKVKQVLVNLVENAMKYSPDGGRVEVCVIASDGHVRVTVTDEGLGIPAGEQQRIFEKFHRLDPNLTRGVGGTGLGLYICRELLQRMNGRIWVESETGRGSAFSFELPAADNS
jgi:signal transduction histidine kinase